MIFTVVNKPGPGGAWWSLGEPGGAWLELTLFVMVLVQALGAVGRDLCVSMFIGQLATSLGWSSKGW